ncbi:MAG: hypothetical protein GC164_04980 [Phycisphaera sp.]|nr:hypothetical protein [Phycisphaera sp.]
MLAKLLKSLINKGLVTVTEIAQVTGRAQSTVYRWVNDESKPEFEDIRLLVRRLSHTDARKSLLRFFTSDLPVIVTWMTDEKQLDPESLPDVGTGTREALDLSLLALDSLSQVLIDQRRALQEGRLDWVECDETCQHLDNAIEYLSVSKQLFRRQALRRKPARRRA